MRGLDNQCKGAKTYNQCLISASEQGIIGPHHHTYQPGKATDRIGFVGKRPSKKTLKELGYTVKPKAERTMTVAEVRALLATLEAKPTAKPVAQTPTTSPIEPETIEEKYRAQQKAKLQQALQVPQYGRNVVLQTKNNPG